MIRHLTTISRTAKPDGDLNAAVIQIPDTGDESVIESDRYRHTIAHGLGRVPVGCMVQLSDKDCRVKVLSSDQNKIEVQFTAEHANVNLRIW